MFTVKETIGIAFWNPSASLKLAFPQYFLLTPNDASVGDYKSFTDFPAEEAKAAIKKIQVDTPCQIPYFFVLLVNERRI